MSYLYLALDVRKNTFKTEGEIKIYMNYSFILMKFFVMSTYKMCLLLEKKFLNIINNQVYVYFPNKKSIRYLNNKLRENFSQYV